LRQPARVHDGEEGFGDKKKRARGYKGKVKGKEKRDETMARKRFGRWLSKVEDATGGGSRVSKGGFQV